MDILSNVNIAEASFVLLATFGSVSLVNVVVKKRTSKELDSEAKIFLSILLAFLFGFVPADLGNVIANRIKEAVVVGVSLNGAYQFAAGVAKKIHS